MNNRSYRVLLTGIMAVVMAVGQIATSWAAEEQRALSLQEVLSAAVNGNPAVTETQKLWEEKVSRVPIAKAWPNPKVGIMKDDIPAGTLSPGMGMMTNYTLSQEIMYPGKLSLMGKMAENQASMAKTNYQEKLVNIYVDAKLNYYDLLYAAKALEIGKEIQQLMGQLAQVSQINYSTGMVPLADTLRVQTEFSTMTTDLVNMAAMEAVARAKVNNVMGRPANAALTIKEEFSAPPPNFDLADLQKTATEAKPAIVGMQYGVEMGKNDVALAKKQKLPDFELRLGYKDYRDAMTNDAWQVELMAMLPVWQSKNRAEIKRATAGLEAAQASLQGMKNMSELDVQMALTEAQSAWRQVDLYKNTIVPQAEQTYQAYVISYTNGKADLMSVLDSLGALRKAKLAYYKSKVDYEKAVANLEKAVGKPLFGDIAGLQSR